MSKLKVLKKTWEILITCVLFNSQAMFKQSRPHQCIRFNYLVDGQGGYFHMFRSMNIRFFNNMAITIKSEEETVG